MPKRSSVSDYSKSRLEGPFPIQRAWAVWLPLMLAQLSARRAQAFDSVLLDTAASVRRKVPDFPKKEDSRYESDYNRPDNMGMRGMCNWIIPDMLMVGQYPGQSPEPFAPNGRDVDAHIGSVVTKAGISLFCSLQSEIPPQDDDRAWQFNGGERYFPDPLVRREFPRPFKHYAPIARSYDPGCLFLHQPIDDCDVPRAESALADLLLKLLESMDRDGRRVYVHCWGGRGRAGLVGACVLSLVYPEKDAEEILDFVQSGYDTRAGAESMPPGLQQSPQTESQREFVRQFVDQRQRHHFFFTKPTKLSMAIETGEF